MKDRRSNQICSLLFLFLKTFLNMLITIVKVPFIIPARGFSKVEKGLISPTCFLMLFTLLPFFIKHCFLEKREEVIAVRDKHDTVDDGKYAKEQVDGEQGDESQ